MLPVIAFNQTVKSIKIVEKISKYLYYLFFILILIIIIDLNKCNCKTKIGPAWTIYIYISFLILSMLINKFLNARLKQIQPLTDMSEKIDPMNFKNFKNFLKK